MTTENLETGLDPDVLKMLAESDGAILGWQVPEMAGYGIALWNPQHAFDDAHRRGVIFFDDETDCYVHPDAWIVEGEPRCWGMDRPSSGGFQARDVLKAAP